MHSSDILAAAARLDGVAHRTPVMTSRLLNGITGAEVYLKCENFQRVGAFKFRGAYNAIACLSQAERDRGVVTYSSGNHAMAVSLASQLLGCKAVVLMPQDAPSVKIDAVRGYGAEIVFYDRFREDRDALARERIERNGYTFVPPYNHPNVVAGQGTVAKELIEETGPLDYLLVQVGGGGLIGGCSVAAATFSPGCKVVGVEPEVANAATRSRAKGEIVDIAAPKSVADGLNSTTVGTLTFPLIQKYVDSFVNVAERDILSAMYFLWTRMKILAEPSGAVPTAGLLYGGVPVTGKRVGVVVSGGNVDVRRAGEYFADVRNDF